MIYMHDAYTCVSTRWFYSRIQPSRSRTSDIAITLSGKYLQSTLLYASETWAFPKHQLGVWEMHRLNVFQTKCLRKICKIDLKDRMSNERILGWCYVANHCLGRLARMPDERL